jgi:hypothetical protein
MRSISVVGVCALALVMLPRTAQAQSPGASETSTTPALAQELSSAPIPGQGGVSVTAGFSQQSGRTETKGWSLDGIVAHTTKKKLLLRLDAETNYADYKATATTPFFKAEDNHLISLLALHAIRPHLSWLTIGGWRRDMVLQLEYRYWVEPGLGWHVIEKPRVNLLVAGMFAVGTEHRTHTDKGSNVADVGFLQTFTAKVHSKFGVEEYLQTHVDTTEADDQATSFNISAVSEIAPHTGLKVYYQLWRDTLPPPGQDPNQSTIGFGLQISFTKKPPAATGKP